MVVRTRAFPRGVFAIALTMVAASCAGRSVSESDGSGGDAGSGGKAAPSGGTGGTGTGGSVPGSGGTGGVPGAGGAVAQGGGTPTGGSGGKGGTGGSVGMGATGGTGLIGNGGASQGGTGSGAAAGSVGIGGAGGIPAPEVCLEPTLSGSCSGFFIRWAFNTGVGRCEQFPYSGCDGNGNNFETEAECVALCEPTSEAAACMSPGDCALVDPECCRCEPALSDLLAVNRVYVNDILAPCALVDCDGCAGPAFSPWWVSLCEAERCIALDARDHELTHCVRDSDCRLRMGLNCCDCGSEPVAVNANVSVEALVCPEGGCMADCEPQYPSDAIPYCLDGFCDVAYPLP